MKKDNNTIEKVEVLLNMNEVDNIVLWEVLDAFVKADINKAKNLADCLGFAIEDHLRTQSNAGEEKCQ